VANSFTSQIVQGTMVKLNEIGPDGKYADDTVTHLIEDQDWGGGTAVGGHTAIVEPQRTLAVSWTTGYRRGRAHRGRIYLPAYASPVNGQLEITNANNVITMAKNLMDGIQATAVLEPAVVSGLGAGTARVITGIEIGSRVDTQRRRRAQLPEYYAVGLA
jgi:hypothetical protein